MRLLKLLIAVITALSSMPAFSQITLKGEKDPYFEETDDIVYVKTYNGSREFIVFCIDKKNSEAYLEEICFVEHSDFELPSYVEYNDKTFPVTVIGNLTSRYSPSWPHNTGSAEDIDNGEYSIIIPDVVREIKPDNILCFVRCGGFTTIQNEHYYSKDGIVYSADGTELTLFPKNYTKDYIMPADVTTIAPYAFSRATCNIYLHGGLDSLSCGLFYEYLNIGNATWPEIYRETNSNIYIPSGIRKFDSSSFGFAPTPFIPDGVVELGNGCLEDGCYHYQDTGGNTQVCRYLFRNDIVIPASVEQLGDYALYNIPDQSHPDLILTSLIGLNEIYILGDVPPQLGRHSLPEPDMSHLSSLSATTEIKLYVADHLTDTYKSYQESGKISDYLKIEALPDKLYVGGALGMTEWKDAQTRLTYQYHCIGNATMTSAEWIVDKPEIAAISEDDVLTALAEGTVSVKCKLTDNSGAEYFTYPLTLDIDEKVLSDVKEISADNLSNRPRGVYNLHGIKVGETTEGLPVGIYIVNGKKVALRAK